MVMPCLFLSLPSVSDLPFILKVICLMKTTAISELMPAVTGFSLKGDADGKLKYVAAVVHEKRGSLIIK